MRSQGNAGLDNARGLQVLALRQEHVHRKTEIMKHVYPNFQSRHTGTALPTLSLNEGTAEELVDNVKQTFSSPERSHMTRGDFVSEE